MNRDQRIRDPVHNLIKFTFDNSDDHVLWALLQTEPMQRLRRIKQLGFSDFVYPGASHTRLSHSIGAMQMARRMLAILARNNVLQRKTKGKNWHLATLCAALLHDVGHGPFSHVFEDVSEELGIKTTHEDYTKLIIEKTELSKLLNKSGILKETMSFFQKETGSTNYSSIISSQLDADRLDFLVRDRYFTGVRSAAIDLEWLFDSLRIEKIKADINSSARQFSFVLDPKGLAVIEEYLSAYAKLYENVYFHKTTRAVQYMIRDILVGVFKDKKYIDSLPEDNQLLVYFNAAPKPPLKKFMCLDDNTIVSFIKLLSVGKFGKYSALAKRYLKRDLYKCFEPPKRPKEEPPREKLGNFIDSLDKKRISYHMDVHPQKGYKQYEIMDKEFLENILVYSPYDEDYRPVVALLPSVKQLSDTPPVRFYFSTEDKRISAIKLWESL